MSETGPMRTGQEMDHIIATQLKDWVAAGWREEFDKLVCALYWKAPEEVLNALSILAWRIALLEQRP